ncbi:MAG: hypothetical protein H7144_06810 [Burkholderiales bacterium]|nr:hypothetical protein [Phycisphaerae bacterium]
MFVQPIQREIEQIPFMAMTQNVERRKHRRHDLENRQYIVERWDAVRKQGTPLGIVADISAGGIRIRSREVSVAPDTHIRLRLRLPTYAGISPFINHEAGTAPANDWVGWLVVSRVTKLGNGTCEIAGRLVDMDEVDRGMLGLYLSTQPMAA